MRLSLNGRSFFLIMCLKEWCVMAKKGTVILIEESLFNYEGIEEYIAEHLNQKEYKPNRYAFTIYDDLMVTNLMSTE